MKNAGRPRADADGGWKDIIEDFTEEFLRFYFPEVHAAIGSRPEHRRKAVQRGAGADVTIGGNSLAAAEKRL